MNWFFKINPLICAITLSLTILHGKETTTQKFHNLTIPCISIQEFIKKFPQTNFIRYIGKQDFQYPAYPLVEASRFPEYCMSGYLDDIFILEIQNGTGYFDQTEQFIIEGHMLQESKIKNLCPIIPNQGLPTETKSFHGRVAIINHPCPYMYGHFIFDILGTLSLLEIHHVEYDYVCIPYDKKYMRQLLELWGIPSEKIIPKDTFTTKNIALHAQTIILPTNISRDNWCAKFINYYPAQTLLYTRNKLLNKTKDYKTSTSDLPKKIFISRKDTKTRCLENEDEVFAVFKAQGYQRFCPTQLSIIEQIMLFHNATHIVGSSGSNMTNILFAQPKTHILEIMQTMPDATFFALAHVCKLAYSCIDDTTPKDFTRGGAYAKGRKINPNIIYKFLAHHPEF